MYMSKNGRFPFIRSALLQLKRLYGTKTEMEKQSWVAGACSERFVAADI
jgi:hypothetical protein